MKLPMNSNIHARTPAKSSLCFKKPSTADANSVNATVKTEMNEIDPNEVKDK